MGRKKKEFNRDGIFQMRFRALCYESGKTQEQLARALGVSRPTISGWLDGKNVPDIISLTRIAEYFDVSADYLLGLSETVSPDVNLRAAVEYTGLSEAAVERLHDGFDYSEHLQPKKSDAEKSCDLSVASALIESREFESIISSFSEAAKWAYLEKTLILLMMQRNEASIAEGKSKADPISDEERGKIMAELLQILVTEGFYVPEYSLNRLRARIDECLSGDGLLGLLDIRDSLDRQQFLVSKAIMEYLGQVVKESRQRAKQKFVFSTSKSEK